MKKDDVQEIFQAKRRIIQLRASMYRDVSVGLMRDAARKREQIRKLQKQILDRYAVYIDY